MQCLRGNFTGGVLLNNRYQTISPLNHGSYGMVFKAFDTFTNQYAAIKCITKGLAAEEFDCEFAIDDKSEEFALHSRLGAHPNIVNLTDAFETDAHFYLVLEYCSQGDLYEAIRRGQGPLQTEHVRKFMLELIDSVAHMHSKGVFHRDIKPENIFLSQDGLMKLGDFGLATTDKWSYEIAVGSDRYMAPEQFDSAGAGFSPAQADVWAIGVCLLNVLFSRNPFTTPTEADPLFLDFSRDKQSLFDVFPSLSQDTYEVIVQCMNLDPQRRSLEGARTAIQRVVSFTTEDEALDDFCCAEKATIASADREPLRTPSLQATQHFDGIAFPWAQSLVATPRRHVQKLSIIPDSEPYTEDLFSKSGETVDWCPAAVPTPSSSLNLSSLKLPVAKPVAIHSSVQAPKRPAVANTAGSLPISMLKPLSHTMSSVFGPGKEVVSKSWSEMWDEDEEEEEELKEQELLARQELNARTWSHESVTPLQPMRQAVDNVAIVGDFEGDIDGDLVADGFFFHEASVVKEAPPVVAPRYSPPSKRNHVDKWAALGERRRAQDNILDIVQAAGAKPTRRHVGFSYKSYEAGVVDNSSPLPKSARKEQRARECPWNQGREWNRRRDRRTDLGDVEWVGGW